MHVIVAGGRKFTDYSFVEKALDKYFDSVMEHVEKEEITIVSADCEGVDAMAERYAKKNGYMYLWMPVRWDVYGEDAWKVTNHDMSYVGNALVAFHDFKSEGTKHMIDASMKMNLSVTIIFCEY